jgi:hypothetical protein
MLQAYIYLILHICPWITFHKPWIIKLLSSKAWKFTDTLHTGPCWMIESLLCVVRNFISCYVQDCTSVPVHTSQACMQNWATGFAHSAHLGSSQISMSSYRMVYREGSALGVSSQFQITECLVTTIYRSRDWNKTRPWKHAESVLTFTEV